MNLPTRNEVLANVNAARRGNATPLRDMCERLSVTGIRYKGQTIRFGYADLRTLFVKAGVDGDDFEELMMACDAAE